MESLEELNWQVVALKRRTKHEIYTLMVTRGKYYMPPKSQTASDFMYDVLIGKKRMSNNKS